MGRVVLKRTVVTGRFMKAISLSCDVQNETRELQHQIKASGQLASKLNYFETEQNPVPGDPF